MTKMTNKHVKLQFFKFSVQNLGFISFIDKVQACMAFMKERKFCVKSWHRKNMWGIGDYKKPENHSKISPKTEKPLYISIETENQIQNQRFANCNFQNPSGP